MSPSVDSNPMSGPMSGDRAAPPPFAQELLDRDRADEAEARTEPDQALTAALRLARAL